MGTKSQLDNVTVLSFMKASYELVNLPGMLPTCMKSSALSSWRDVQSRSMMIIIYDKRFVHPKPTLSARGIY